MAANEKIHILCRTRAFIEPLKLMGPIVHPLYVEKSAVLRMVYAGLDVYEYIPATKNTIKLTVQNINKANRLEEAKAPVNTKTPEPVEVKTAPTVKTPEVVKVPTVPVEPKKEEVKEGPWFNKPVDITFEYTSENLVDESKIDWTKYSKEERKIIRGMINAHNDSVKK